MATGRTVNRYLRVYLNGYDLSGYARNLGNIGAEWETPDLTVVADAAMGTLPNERKLVCGPFNGLLDNTATSGLHAVTSGSAGSSVVLTAAIGVRAVPAQGDAAFCALPLQDSYTVSDDSGAMAATIKFGQIRTGLTTTYINTWGVLLHASGAETAVNTAVGIDDNGGASTGGGVLYYHALTSNGSVTLKVQDAATNTNVSFSDLSGATTGNINPSSAPLSGAVSIGNTATVRQYLRWQLVFGTATTATFVMAFIRG